LGSTRLKTPQMSLGEWDTAAWRAPWQRSPRREGSLPPPPSFFSFFLFLLFRLQPMLVNKTLKEQFFGAKADLS
jgi:hypothetical protein